jgi:hypothetical protein
MTGGCVDCGAAAVVCQECVRALAMKWFGATARHPETGTSCVLCEQDLAVYCPACFIEHVAGYRSLLRQAGTHTGEPAT